MHEFGTLIFGNLNINGDFPPGVFHSEGGVLVGGSIYIDHGLGDFGQVLESYNPAGHLVSGGYQLPETDYRLVVAGDITMTNPRPEHVYALQLHLGSLLVNKDSTIDSALPFEVRWSHPVHPFIVTEHHGIGGIGAVWPGRKGMLSAISLRKPSMTCGPSTTILPTRALCITLHLGTAATSDLMR